MGHGVLTVAFHPSYDKLGAACATITRQHTNLPIHVITNVPDSQRANWPSNCTFQYVAAAQCQNRHWKTQAWHHTPFDATLYMDCDVVVLNPGVETIFDTNSLETTDMVLNPYLTWKTGERVLKIYRDAMLKFNVTPPIVVYSGCCNMFHRTDITRKIYDRWHLHWKATGKGREMPSLACAVALEPTARVFSFPLTVNLDIIGANPTAVLHHMTAELAGLHKITIPERWCPFDREPNAFSWVDF